MPFMFTYVYMDRYASRGTLPIILELIQNSNTTYRMEFVENFEYVRIRENRKTRPPLQ